jgi:hypothetical protein
MAVARLNTEYVAADDSRLPWRLHCTLLSPESSSIRHRTQQRPPRPTH